MAVIQSTPGPTSPSRPGDALSRLCPEHDLPKPFARPSLWLWAPWAGGRGVRDEWHTQGHRAVGSPSTTWSYTLSSQVRIRSNRSLQFWNLSGRGLIRLFLSNMCKMPFCV